MAHDLFLGGFRNILQAFRNGRIKFTRVEILPGTIPIFAIFSTIGASAFAGGLSFISIASELEIGCRIHSVHLLPHRGLHVDFRIDFALGRRVGLAEGAQGNKGILVLDGMDRLIVLGVPVQ